MKKLSEIMMGCTIVFPIVAMILACKFGYVGWLSWPTLLTVFFIIRNFHRREHIVDRLMEEVQERELKRDYDHVGNIDGMKIYCHRQTGEITYI